jgi:hypothetical protein
MESTTKDTQTMTARTQHWEARTVPASLVGSLTDSRGVVIGPWSQRVKRANAAALTGSVRRTRT